MKCLRMLAPLNLHSEARLAHVLQTCMCTCLSNCSTLSQLTNQSARTPTPPSRSARGGPHLGRRNSPVPGAQTTRAQESLSPFFSQGISNRQSQGAQPSRCASLKPDRFSSSLPRTATSMTTQSSSLCLDDLSSLRSILSRAATVAPLRAKSAATLLCL